MAITSIPIAEVFGPTIQGEGQLAGRPTYFLRVGGCDFACAWCDSGHAVLVNEVRKLPRMTTAEIISALIYLKGQKPGPEWLTISGGNPALYDLEAVAVAWQSEGGKVAVETQGSKWKDWLAYVDLLTISPKPPSSEMTNGEDFRHFMAKALLLETLITPVCLKVVVFDEEDYRFAQTVHQQYPKVPFYLSCGTAMGGLSGEWLSSIRQPQGRLYIDTEGDLLTRYRWLAERAMNDSAMADVAVYPQLHSLLWGITTRGV